MSRKQLAFVIALCLSLLTLTSALASGAPTSQFGYSGWPYRQSTSCTVESTQAPCIPTAAPTAEPTAIPTVAPTAEPTCIPTAAPTAEPTVIPTTVPTAVPTVAPTQAPTPKPTATPTVKPTVKPTAKPTATPTDDDYTTDSITAQEQTAVKLMNQDRVANGLPALVVDPALCALARLKSCDMNANNYFAHTSPTLGSAADMLKAHGYSFSGVGENIAHHATVEKSQAAFMSSDGHRRNILGSQWTKCGIGVCYDKNGFVYVTQLFVR